MSTKRGLAIVAALTLAVSGLSATHGIPRAGAAGSPEGSLDTAFGTSGVVTTSFDTRAEMHALTVQQDGKIVVAGNVGDSFALARYAPDGTIDNSFGAAGSVLTDPEPPGSSYQSSIYDVAEQPDGKLVAAGVSGNDSAVLRYNPGGTLDTTFGGTGLVTARLGISGGASAVMIQPDGKIVVAGTVLLFNDDVNAFAVLRYNPDGNPDTSFGSLGYARFSPAGEDSELSGAALQPDGKIVLVGTSRGPGAPADAFLVARLTSTGQVDTTFHPGSGSGAVLTSFGSQRADAYGATMQPDGKIVVAGHYGPQIALARYTTAGALDRSFSSDGKLTTTVGSTSSYAARPVVQRNGMIVVAGASSGSTGASLLVARYTASGALDRAFSGDGVQTTRVGTGAWAKDVAVQSDGKIVVGGQATLDPAVGTSLALTRYVGDTHPPAGGRMVGMPRYSRFVSRVLDWTARDDNTGVQTYAVRYRDVTANGTTYGPYVTWQNGASTSARFFGLPGHTYAFSVRAVDRAGNVGSFGSASYLAFPVDDRGLVAAHGWTPLAGPQYYADTALRSTHGGARLALGVHYRHLVLLAGVGPGSGTVKVYLGTTLLKTVSLAAATARNRVLFTISATSALRAGTVRIIQASAGKPVVIDGLIASHQ